MKTKIKNKLIKIYFVFCFFIALSIVIGIIIVSLPGRSVKTPVTDLEVYYSYSGPWTPEISVTIDKTGNYKYTYCWDESLTVTGKLSQTQIDELAKYMIEKERLDLIPPDISRLATASCQATGELKVICNGYSYETKGYAPLNATYSEIGKKLQSYADAFDEK